MRRFCPDCATELKKGEFYCKSCNPDFEKMHTKEELAQIKANYEKGNKRGCLLILGLLLLTALVLFAIYIYSGEDGVSAAVLNIVFIIINFVLFKLNRRSLSLENNYYNLTLKERPTEPTYTAPIQNKPVMESTEASEPIARFCSNCGKALEPNSKFCGNCGTPIQQ